jgi:hypothetical protein
MKSAPNILINAALRLRTFFQSRPLSFRQKKRACTLVLATGTCSRTAERLGVHCPLVGVPVRTSPPSPRVGQLPNRYACNRVRCGMRHRS